VPTRASRRCTFPGCTNTTDCAKHRRMRQSGLDRTTPTKVAERQPGIRQHRGQAVASHVRRYGWVCLGDEHHDSHPTRDLVADDPIPISLGGDPKQTLAVMCRSANSRKGSHPPSEENHRVWRPAGAKQQNDDPSRG
jgi:hypothetical protein